MISYNIPMFEPDTNRPDMGRATNQLVYTAQVGTNADMFPQVMRLHVSPGATVADVTYGRGGFWRQIPEGLYNVLPTDIQTGTDLRKLPYTADSIDCVVMDPPYMEGLYRKTTDDRAGHGNHDWLREYYSQDEDTPDDGSPKWHAAVIDLYRRGGHEAFRVLREGGVLVLKCQDEVSTNVNHLTHLEIFSYYTARLGFDKDVDLFVLVRRNRPVSVGIHRQVHARKNHSYFMVFKKPTRK